MLETRNPYAAPQADVHAAQTFESGDEVVDASLGLRFANFALDSIFRIVALVALGAIMAAVPNESIRLTVTMIALVGYHVIFETLTGRTPAKYLTGTRVVDQMGGKASFLQILGRSAARFLPFEPFSFLGSSHRGWHDSLSRTRVVRV